MGLKILVVDDEKLIVKGLRYSLLQEGMEVDCAYDGGEAVDLISKNSYDCILLDVMMPVLSGYDVLRKVREFSDVPIIMLTARSEDIDKIMGLEYGADDYVTKPFNIVEVKARIKAILRRNLRAGAKRDSKQEPVVCGELNVDFESRRVFVRDNEINLTAKEFDLLELLIKNPDKVFSREKLLETVWGTDFPGDERTVDVHVRRLREKIEDNPGEPKYVQTKWGVGYFFRKR